jgi:hypothetical protein
LWFFNTTIATTQHEENHLRGAKLQEASRYLVVGVKKASCSALEIKISCASKWQKIA